MTNETSLPAVGDVLRDKYRLDAVLGEGGFGRVYSATELGTGRRTAVKVLKGRQVKLALRFRREARAIAGLHCDSTLTLFDFGEHDGCFFMVTEFIDGEDLSDRLNRVGALAEHELVRVLSQVLESLREAHHQGLLHRDIKPANIRLFDYADDPLRVKVLDFGLAKAMDGSEVALTSTGAVIGTPRYMSPEQLMGDDLTGASDIFSLGVVALESLLGPAHPLISDIANRLTGLQLGDEREVSPALRDIVNRMLARERDARYASADEVLRDLHGLSRGAAAEPRTQVPAVVRPSPAALAPRLAEPPRRTALWGGVAALAVAVVAAGVLLGRPKPEPAPVRSVNVSALLTAPARPEEATVAKSVELPSNAKCSLPFRGEGYIREPGNALDARRWYTYIPSSLDSEGPHPLIVLLHQQGHTGEIFLDHGGFKPIADRHGLILAAPTESDFSAWAPYHRHVDRVIYMIEELSSQLCIDKSRIFAVGHGSGAGITPLLACRGLLAGWATHALSMAPGDIPCAKEAKTPAYLLMYPKKSGYEPFDGGVTCSGANRISATDVEDVWLKRHQCSRAAAPSHRDGDTTCWEHECAMAPLQTCHIDGGHGWSGTPVRSREFRVRDCDGPTPVFPMAEHIWEFFARVAPRGGGSSEAKPGLDAGRE